MSKNRRRQCAQQCASVTAVPSPVPSPVRPRHALVGDVAVGLQDAAEVLQERRRVLAPPSRRVAVDHRRRIGSAPRPIVAGNRPEVAGLGPAATRVEHRRLGLVDEQLRRAEQVLADQAPQRLELGRRVPHPAGERRAVDGDPLAGQHLCLAIERRVVGILRHQHVRHHPLGGQAALDQPDRRRRLRHRARAGSAAVFRAAGDDDLVACRDHVEALGPVLADDVHGAVAARARRLFRLDHHLDPRQVIRQGAAALPPLPAARLADRLIRLLLFGLALGNRLFEVLERESELVGIEPLGVPAELHPLQLPDEVAQALVLILDAAAFGALGFELGAHRQHRGAQAEGIVGKIVESRRHRRFVA